MGDMQKNAIRKKIFTFAAYTTPSIVILDTGTASLYNK